MFDTADLIAMVAVKDLEVAKNFYGNTLGLHEESQNPAGVNYSAGSGKLFVYTSDTAGQNPATSVTIQVDNLEETVESLRNKGVVYENYDIPGAEKNGDIHIIGPYQTVWFKDPEANIIAITNKV